MCRTKDYSARAFKVLCAAGGLKRSEALFGAAIILGGQL